MSEYSKINPYAELAAKAEPFNNRPYWRDTFNYYKIMSEFCELGIIEEVPGVVIPIHPVKFVAEKYVLNIYQKNKKGS